MGTRNRVDLVEKGNFLLSLGTETQFIGRPIQCLGNVWTELSCLVCVFNYAESVLWPMFLVPREKAWLSTHNPDFRCVHIPEEGCYNWCFSISRCI
jgi:hypothetical protein